MAVDALEDARNLSNFHEYAQFDHKKETPWDFTMVNPQYATLIS